MNIYIDSDFKCHTNNDGTMTEIETDFFDSKCQTFIEGYRFVPNGANWIREDGKVFKGEMVVPFKDYSELDEAQRQYEKEILLETQEALSVLLGEVEV